MKHFLFLFLSFFLFTGVQSQSLMTVAEVYDYTIGDIFITKAGGYISPPTYTKKIITDKYYSPLADTVYYTYDSYSYTPQACQTCSPVYDTILSGTLLYTNLSDTIGAGLGAKIHYWNPSCIDTAGYTGVWLDTIYYDTAFCNTLSTRIYVMDNGPQLTDTCYSYFEPFFGFSEYGKGIGQKTFYYNTCADGVLNCQQGIFLLYFKKGADSCGTAPVMTDIHELKLKSTFILFPNPSTDEMHLDFFEEQRSSLITVTNVFGEEVKQFNFSGRRFTLEKGELKTGVYLIRVDDRNNIYSSKLIVQ